MENLTFSMLFSEKATFGIWILTLSGLFIPILTIIGIVIARNQFKVAKQQYNHDLFDKRLIIFSAVIQGLRIAASSKRLTAEDFGAFYSGTFLADYFFEDYTVELIKDYLKKFEDLKLKQALLEVNENEETVKAIKEYQYFFENEYMKIKLYFDQYFKQI